MMIQKMLKLILLIAQMVAVVACGVSDAEKEERRINAFDLSGGWMAQGRMGVPSSGLYDGVTLFISNEENDRSNIKVEVIRDAWSAEEEDFVNQLEISSIDRDRIRNKYDGTFTIGKGKHQDLIGGENISDDFGETSKVYVTTNGSESLKTTNDIEVNYYLDAKINHNDFVLRGSLRMTATRMREEVDANGTTTIHLKNIKISQIDDETFHLRPNVRVLHFRGERFELSDKLSALIELKIVTHPTLDFTYIGNQGSVLHFGGSVRSLGHFSGSVEYFSDLKIETMGYFDFKRL